MFASVRLKTHEIGTAAKRIGTVMVHFLMSRTQGQYSNPGHQSKGHHVPLSILLDDVVLGVQAPREEPLQEVAARSFLVVLAC